MAPPAPPTVEGEYSDGATSAPQNASAQGAEGGPRTWERAWTVGEMRKEANNWSLAGDAGLLQYLQEFSHRVISRTHEIGKEVDGLVHEAKLTEVRVNNVFNDFIMLANTQFVENRVYDEDVSQANQEEDKKTEPEEKTREQREAELIPKVTEALRHGVNVIEQAFEKLDTNIGDSDSEDDDGGYRADPILEAKDPYVTRSLPLLIGSPGFLQDDTVGLMEDVSEGEETDHGSISQSEEEESEDEYSDSDIEERKKDKERRATVASDETESDEEEESDEDMFGSKTKKREDDDDDEESEEESGSENEKGEDEETEKAPAKKGTDFSSELAARIGAAVPKPQPFGDDSDEESEEKPKQPVKEKKKKESKKEKKHKSKTKHAKAENEDLFGGEEEDSSPFSKTGGMFTSSKGLFDDDEDDTGGGLFDEIEKPARKQSTKKVLEESEEEEEEKEEEPVIDKRPRTASGRKVPTGGVNIFGDGDSGLFGSSIKEEEDTAVSERKPSKSTPTPSGGGGGLFDDEDEGDDLFSPITKKSEPKKENTTKTTSAPKKSKLAGDLFADENEEDDLFAGQSAASFQKKSEPPAEEAKPKTKKTEKKLPPGAVSMFGGAPNPLTAAIKKQRPASESEDGDLDDGEKSRSGSVKSSQSSSSLRGGSDNVKKTSRSASASSNSLFADDVDEDLFSTKPKTDSAKPSKSKSATSSGLFADDEDDQGDLFGTGSKAPSKPAQTKKDDKPKQKSSALFGDEEDVDDEDMFSVKSKPKDSGKKKPPGGVALFGGADIFKKKTEAAPEEPKKEDKPDEKTDEKPPPRKATLSLFDADDDDGGNLFDAGPKPKAKLAPAPAKKESQPKGKEKKSLFEDEDILFGGAAEDAPDVDLFNKPGPLGDSPKTEPPKSASKPSVKVGGATTKSSTTDLFDDDDSDPLFGGPKKDNAQAKDSKEGGETVDIAGATTTESSDSGPLPVQEEPKPAVSKPKKPAGAVSMFGGLDPSALLKKKKKPVDEEEEKPSEPENKPEEKKSDALFGGDSKEGADIFTVVAPKPKPPPTATKPASPQPKPDQEKPKLFSPPSTEDSEVIKGEGKTEEEEPKTTAPRPKRLPGAVSMFGGMSPGALPGLKKKLSQERQDSEDSDVPVPPELPDVDESAAPSSEPVLGKRLPGKIGKLKGGLAINPAALLPGAAPPRTEVVDTGVGFNEPAEVKTLTSASKDRARIITRRRPMSRKARHSAALSGVFDDFSPTMSPTTPTDPSPLAQSDDKASSPPRTEKRDLFGNDDILGDSVKDTPVLGEGRSSDKDLFSDGLFTKKGDKAKQSDSVDGLFDSSAKSDKKTPPLVDDDDLFASKPSSDSKKDKKAPVVEDDVDLFASSKQAKTATDKAGTKSESVKDTGGKQEEKKKSKVVDDDDIFADSSINKKKDTKTKAPVAKDDDVFADSSVSKKSTPKAAVTEDDDIFATPAPSVEKKKLKKASVKDETLFKDDTDIFADIPASKSKESKKKKKTAPSEKKSIFKDDIDDIFADSSPVGTKSKKDTKKKVKDSGKGTADDGDLFDDPLGTKK